MSRRIEEVTVFTNGDSAALKIWSNVPYFLTSALLARGIRVNRVDISERRPLQFAWNRSFGLMRRLFFRHSTFDYYRSGVHHRDVRRRVRQALARFPAADAHLFLTCSFSAHGLSSVPAVLLCDWSYEHYFRYFLSREPDLLERRAVRQEAENIERADHVICLFPTVAEFLRSNHRRHIDFIGAAVNSFAEPAFEAVSAAKASSGSLLFVGSPKYIDGARVLVAAFERLKARRPSLRLDMIGLVVDDFPQGVPEGVVLHGYLDKEKEDERARYYALLHRARVFVNTTPKWGAYSAALEAMYNFTPVIVTPYDDFVAMFGREIAFGRYCERNEPAALEACIEAVLSAPGHDALCRAAHEAVKGATWDAFAARMLAVIENGRA